MKSNLRSEINYDVLNISGEIDLHHSPKLREEILGSLKGRKSLLINMEEVSYIDSSGIASNNEIPVNYKLRLRSDGWFVYDVEVENVSMVSSYRETYRSVVRRSGMDGLLTQMREKAAQGQ